MVVVFCLLFAPLRRQQNETCKTQRTNSGLFVCFHVCHWLSSLVYFMLFLLSKFHSEPAKENLRSWFTNKHVCMHVSVYMDMRVCVCVCMCIYAYSIHMCWCVCLLPQGALCIEQNIYISIRLHAATSSWLETVSSLNGLSGFRPSARWKTHQHHSPQLLSWYNKGLGGGWSDQKLNKCQRLSATEFPRCTVRHRCVCWWPEPQIAQAAGKETKTPGWFRTILNAYPAKWKHLFWRGKRPSLVGDQVGAVEADTELTNHANVTSRGHRFHECLSSWLCDGAEVVDQFVLGHANARILDGQGGVRLVGDDLDEEVGLGLRNANFLCPFLAQNGWKAVPCFNNRATFINKPKNFWKGCWNTSVEIVQITLETSKWIKMKWNKKIETASKQAILKP